MPDLIVAEIIVSRATGGYAAALRVWHENADDWGGGPYSVNLDLEALRAQASDAEAYGRLLTAALFSDPNFRSDFSEARTAALDGVLRLRLCVDKSAPELHFVRWELLRDPDDDDNGFISMHENIRFSRYLRRGRPGKARGELPEARQNLRALAAAANPLDLKDKYNLAQLDVPGEQNRARSGLVGIKAITVLPADQNERCTLNTLIDRVRGVDILYLACHGRLVGDTPWLLLEDTEGNVARVSGKKLVEGIGGLEEKPRLVILASCESASSATGEALAALGPRLVLTAGVPAVVAMQGPVAIATVEAFMPVFFRELMKDGDIDRAMAFARRAAGDALDWWSPVLYMNLFRGQLWQPPGTTPSTLTVDDWVKPRILERPETSFIGRASELARMEKVIREGENGQRYQVMQIWGASGSGKTALARQLIEGLHDFFPDGQIEVDLRGKKLDGTTFELTAAEALQTLLRGVSSHPDAKLTENVWDLRHLYLQRFNDRKVAILLDDTTSPSQIQPFVPPPRGCLLLITGSSRLCEVPDLWELKLGRMLLEDAVKMLLALAPRAGAKAEKVVEACDRLPQGVYKVGTTLRDRPNLPVEVMIIRLQVPSIALKETGLDLSLQSTCEIIPSALLIDWRKLAVIEGEFDELDAAAVWGWITAESSEEAQIEIWDRANQRLGDMLDYGVIEYDAERQRYSLLRLVRAFAISQSTTEEIAEAKTAYAAYKR